MSELRFERAARRLLHLVPEHPRALAAPAPLRGPEGCPLCPGGPAHQGPRLAETGGCFATPVGRPALRVEARSGFRDLGPYEVSEGLGAHELLLPDLPHGAPPRALGVQGWASLLQVAGLRMRDLRGDRRLGPMSMSLGWRAEAGAVVDHLHAQVHAFPTELEARLPKAWIPEPDARLEVRRSARFALRCDASPASPFALTLHPLEPLATLDSLSEPTLLALAEALQDALERLHGALGERPLSLGLWARPAQPWAIRLRPWIRPTSTLEQALGLPQHEVSPERAAEALRAATPV
ncbi:MAG: hypothetical protein H6741_03415 [Alphaproteobacteria bacterium]|nr:hypothetical protein [Alphaproteobacteria bacterium]MCB9791754.1 hypothetical protein [Alphaproteobacteria bacterium]